MRAIRVGHGAKSRVISFLAGEGNSLVWEGDDDVSGINNGVMSCEVGHSWEHVRVVK